MTSSAAGAAEVHQADAWARHAARNQYATIVLVSIGGGALPKVPVVTLLAFLFVLGVLIFVHELGHFLMARAHGVRVLRFSLGFDPKILKFTRGGTEYSIGIIPLGGFVKLAGETVDDERTGAPDEFLSKSKWVRFQVYLAGPIMNLLLAVIVLAFVLMKGADVPLYQSASAVVGAVEAGARRIARHQARRPDREHRRPRHPDVGCARHRGTPKANRPPRSRSIGGGERHARDTPAASASDSALACVRSSAAVRGDSAGMLGARRVPARRCRPALDGQRDRSAGGDRKIKKSADTHSRSRSSATARRGHRAVPDKGGLIGVTPQPGEVRRRSDGASGACAQRAADAWDSKATAGRWGCLKRELRSSS